MNILHVTDLHLNPRWYEWLIAEAPRHDLLCISGDLLSDHDPAPNRRQISRATEWLRRIDRPMVICSGNHDLEWDEARERWQPARWLRDLAGPQVWVDGDSFDRGALRFHAISCTTHPKGAFADVWVVHAPPSGLAVGRRQFGNDNGDPDLNESVLRFGPRVVLCGHVHEPSSWFEQQDGVMYLNPGSVNQGRFPNHILFDTDSFTAHRVTDSVAGARCEIATWKPMSRDERREFAHA